MSSRRTASAQWVALLFVTVSLLALTCCTGKSTAQTSTVDLRLDLKTPFRFVAYGDTRFHDPSDTEAANPSVRVALVKAIAEVNPAFICFTGDIVYNGYDAGDWKVWDNETSVWRDKKIPIYPALGNHDLHGDQNIALGNYFQRFPELKNSRYYSVQTANTLILVLDSSLEEISGPEGQWLAEKLDHVPSDVDFVFLMFHHPPYTTSSDAKVFGGGHSARSTEQALAKMIEERQAHARFRIVVFSGHVHNYERHEHGGVTYFVSGGGGAHAYPVERAASDPFQSKLVNYHYLLVEVDGKQLTVTMNRMDLTSGKAVWTQPDSVKITAPAAAGQRSGRPLGRRTLASPFTPIFLPRRSQRVEDQAITKRQLLWIEHGSIGVLGDRIAGNTPALVADDSAAMFACRLCVVLVAVIPKGCRLGWHVCASVRFNKFPVA